MGKCDDLNNLPEDVVAAVVEMIMALGMDITNMNMPDREPENDPPKFPPKSLSKEEVIKLIKPYMEK